MKQNKRIHLGALLAVMLLMSAMAIPAMAYEPGTPCKNESIAGDSIQLTGENRDIMTNVDVENAELGFNGILNSYETVTMNPKIFMNDVSDGQVTLKLLGQEFNLELQEMDIVSNDAKIITREGANISISDAPKISSYEGTVIGEKNSKAILTVADNVLIGDIYIDDKVYSIEQTSMKHSEKVVHVIYSSDDAKKNRKILEYNTDGDDTESVKQDASSLLMNEALDYPSLLRSTPTVDIMACYDSEFIAKYSDPSAEIQGILASVESLAFSPANVNLNINAYNYYANIPNGDPKDVFADFESVAESDRDSTNSDLAFLFTGKEMSGSVIGKAYIYTGSSDRAYAIGQMVSAGSSSSYQATSTGRKVLTTHELGHNFGATHEEAYSWDICYIFHHYTAMKTPFEGTSFPNYMQIEFSNLNDHGDSSHNNILHVVSNKNTIAGFQ